MHAQELGMVTVCTCVVGPTLTEVIVVRWQLGQVLEKLQGSCSSKCEWNLILKVEN